MTLATLFKLLHVLIAFGFVGGQIGRALAFRQAGQATDIQSAYALLQLSDQFERRLVIPGSMAVLLVGLLTAWVAGWPLLGVFQGATANWLLVSWVLFLSPMPLIPLYLIPRRRLRAQVAEQALAQGQVTPELTAALNDRGVMQARLLELLVAGVVAGPTTSAWPAPASAPAAAGP